MCATIRWCVKNDKNGNYSIIFYQYECDKSSVKIVQLFLPSFIILLQPLFVSKNQRLLSYIFALNAFIEDRISIIEINF